MKNYKAIIVALEEYHHKDSIGSVKHAKDDAEAIRDALTTLGCPAENIIYLNDNYATKTRILDEIQQLSQNAQAHETIAFYFAGHGFFENNTNYLSCVDTSLNNLPATAIPIIQLMSAFEVSPTKKVIVFLDCCHSGINFTKSERSIVKAFSTDDLKYNYAEAEHLTVFSSCKDQEKSQVDLERKHGVWSYFLIQALSGNVSDLYEGDLLFSDRLHSYLHQKTQQRVSQITTPRKTQTPVKYGKETQRFIVADLSKALKYTRNLGGKMVLDYSTAKYIGKHENNVITLKGFKPSHRRPRLIDSYHSSWIEGIAHENIKELANELASNLRHHLVYKHKDYEIGDISDGEVLIVGKNFKYDLKITQSATKADKYVLIRSVSGLTDNPVDDNSFNWVFGKNFHELSINFVQPINLGKLVEQAERAEVATYKFNYDAVDMSQFDIVIPGFAGSMTIFSNKVLLRTRDNKYLKELLNDFTEKLALFKSLPYNFLCSEIF